MNFREIQIGDVEGIFAIRIATWHNGIGGRLLRLIEESLRSHEWKEIWLTTDTDERLRAVGFYRHMGWEDWKIEGGDRYMRKLMD